MRKLGFYPRLAAGNLWRNRATYLPYLIASVTCVLTFYTLLAINNSSSLGEMYGAIYVEMFSTIGVFICGIFMAILLFWTNSFLIKRRTKEMALYSILGMEKRNIALVMLFETLFTAVISLALGLLGGALLSRLLYLVLLRLMNYSVMISLPISISGMATTAIYFCVVFGVILLRNLRQVSLANPSEMLQSSKNGEREPKTSWLLTLAGLVFLGAGYGLAIYFKNAIEAVLVFLVAALLVILGTYCLFTSGSIALLKMLKRNKSYYYTSKHFISVSGMIYRMKQNAAGLSTICILSCMVLVTMSATASLYVGMEDSLTTIYPNEITVELSGELQDDREALNQLQREVEAMAAANTEITVESIATMLCYDTVIAGGDGVYTSRPYLYDLSDKWFYAITQDDYNAMTGSNLLLGEGEALAYAYNIGESHGTLTIDGLVYQVQYLSEMPSLKPNINAVSEELILIVPDSAAMEALKTASVVNMQKEYPELDIAGWSDSTPYLTLNLDGSQSAREDFAGELEEYLRATAPYTIQSENSDGEPITIYQARAYLREEMRVEWYSIFGGFMFLGIYLGILFLLAAVMIIYYKQLSEGYDDRERFDIMQKVGMSEYEVRKTIHSQVRTVFILPLAIAIIHIAVAFVPVSRGMSLFGISNIPLLVITTVCTVLVYALVYLLVYRQTARTYFKIVRRKG